MSISLLKVNVLVLLLFSNCKAYNSNEKMKTMVVDEIILKVHNLTSAALSKASPVGKEQILEKIENKLKLSAKPYGTKADKYVSLIMQGLRLLSSVPKNESDRIKSGSHHKSDHIKPGYHHARSNINILRKNDNTESNSVVHKIIDKFVDLAKKYTQNVTSTHDKQKIMETMKHKIIRSVQKQHEKIHSKHYELKTYTDLLTRGMEFMMRKIADNKQREPPNMKPIFNSNINEEHVTLDPNGQFLPHNIEILEDGDVTKSQQVISPYLNRSTPASCDTVVLETCKDIKAMNQLSCPNSNIILPLNKLCDGYIDCPDESDETRCLYRAVAKLQRASQIMIRVETFLSKKCVLSNINPLLMKQNIVFSDVLRRQLGILQRFASLHAKYDHVNESIKMAVADVAVVINALTIALDGTLCTVKDLRSRNIDNIIRRHVSMLDDDIIPDKPKSKITVKRCGCTDSFCSNSTCPDECKVICWYKYSLNRLSCQAVDESTSVPLNAVCDGKLDCYDENDETGCNIGANSKFDANVIYGKVLEMIQAKSISKEYKYIKSKLIALHNKIRDLQKETLRSGVDLKNIRELRDDCFASIVSIYEDIVNDETGKYDLRDAQLFLLTLNEKLIAALKVSNAGNDKIIPRDGCYCRQQNCIVANCPKSCENACRVRPKLTRYWCKGMPDKNITIPIEWLCNKIADCPLDDDEAECSTEVCRRHHLVLLKHSIRDVGDKEKGTSIGESLKLWKTKVASTLKLAENNMRLTPFALRESISDILNDLTMTYAAIEVKMDSRRSSKEDVFSLFLNASQRIIETLRLCGK